MTQNFRNIPHRYLSERKTWLVLANRESTSWLKQNYNSLLKLIQTQRKVAKIVPKKLPCSPLSDSSSISISVFALSFSPFLLPFPHTLLSFEPFKCPLQICSFTPKFHVYFIDIRTFMQPQCRYHSQEMCIDVVLLSKHFIQILFISLMPFMAKFN